MSFTSDELALLQQLSRGLGSFRSYAVFTGGWAHRLMRLHPLAIETPYTALTTQDADIVLPDPPPIAADLHASMLNAGFHPRYFGSNDLPKTRYLIAAGHEESYVEFLAPLVGPEFDRQGESRARTRIGDVPVERLRGLGLLLVDPWTVRIPMPDVHPLAFQVVHPVSYIVQKLLSLGSRRHAADSEKDLLYVHDTLELFWDALSELQHWQELHLKSELTDRNKKALQQTINRIEMADSSWAVGAAQLAREAGRPLAASQLQGRLHFGLQQLLGLP